MIRKHQTACCALCQLTANDNDSYEDLEAAVNEIKKSAKESWTPSNRNGGERGIFVMATQDEKMLKKNLHRLGFDFIAYIPRRNGYHKGFIDMYLLIF